MTALQFQNVSYRYPMSQRPIINNLNLNIEKGEVVAILGQNGTGKSTLFKLALADLSPSHGHVLFQGQAVSSYPPQVRASKIISLTQRVDQSLFMDLSVSENLDLWRYRFHLALSNEDLLRSLSFKERLEELKSHTVRSLSGGEQQLLLSALIFAASPALLFLDEHTSQLDPHISEAIMTDLLLKAKKHHTTVLMITHDLQDALNYADRIIILRYKKPHVEYAKNAHTTLSELKEALL
jgi:putative tryptophan/tyrosine transport system ATP-binding protein